MAKRTVILHYHLFKNAGTSVDRILQDNFPDRWVTREFHGQNNTAQVAEWIKANPKAVAFSSHTVMGPLPRIPGVKILPVILLRDPLARIRSAYQFERDQKSDNFGAVLAKHTDFEGYVRVRLALPGDRQCRNFQTWRLASMVPGPEPELERAVRALEELSVVGLVSAFGTSMEKLKDALKDVFPDFKYDAIHMNSSKASKSVSPDSSIEYLLQQENQDDLTLVQILQREAVT